MLGIISVVLYFVVYPLLTWAVSFIHYKLRIQKQLNAKPKAGQKKKPINAEQQRTLLNKWNEKIKFTLTDKRLLLFSKPKDNEEAPGKGIERRFVFFTLYGIGLAISVSQFLFETPMLLVFSFAFYVAAMVFGVYSAKKLLEARAAKLKKMFEIASAKLGYTANTDPRSAIRVKEWMTPLQAKKIEFDIPTTFASEGEAGFLRQFNQVFGTEMSWVADTDLEAGKNGWNYEDGVLTIRSVPPLPVIAPWTDEYVMHPGISWSFFPLGLGIEDGVELPDNEDQEKIKNVIGIDFSGKQGKAAKNAGVAMSSKIMKTPMALIAGGTGGGKAKSSDTPIRIIKRTT